MTLRKILVSAMAATALSAIPAAAQSTNDADKVSAHALIQTDMKSGDVAIGTVDDFVLSSDGSHVEFVLFSGNKANSNIASATSFVPWRNIQLDADNIERDLMIVGSDDSEGQQELTMTRAEANTRMLSRILDADLAFADGVVRPIDDLLFDPQTGMVEDIVVEFADGDKMIPAEFVRVSPADGYSAVQPSDYGYTVYIVG